MVHAQQNPVAVGGTVYKSNHMTPVGDSGLSTWAAVAANKKRFVGRYNGNMKLNLGYSVLTVTGLEMKSTE